MKKLSIGGIVTVSFCVLSYDCHVRTMIWRGFNIRFPRKYEKFEKIEYVIFDMVFSWTCCL